jgi:putative hydrolase of the HAD superfamily
MTAQPIDLTPADLTHIDTWLFDLDNTLYPVSSGFMSQIERRMTDFVQQVTGLARDEAYKLQKKYLAEYGLTLGGMIEHHGVDPADYHAMFHDLPLEGLTHDPELLAALGRLPGRRLIFTNADGIHAERVLKHLGLDHLFSEVFHIGSGGYLPKPDPAAFAAISADHAIDPNSTAFFEDSERNLAPAADLGMTTVLVGPTAPASTAPFIDYKTDNLASFLSDARLKEPA